MSCGTCQGKTVCAVVRKIQAMFLQLFKKSMFYLYCSASQSLLDLWKFLFFLNLLVGFYFFFFPFKLGRCSLSWLVENSRLAENKAWKQQFTRLSAGFQINTNLWTPCFGPSRPKDNKMVRWNIIPLYYFNKTQTQWWNGK